MVTIVPSKARIYADELPQPLPVHANSRYHFFTSWLKQQQISYLGLLTPLTPKNAQATFVKNDTHWSLMGAQQPPKLVIWEVPERYLVISPNLAQEKAA